MIVIRLSNTDKQAVHSDIDKLIPDWQGTNEVRRLNSNLELCEKVNDERELEPKENYEYVSGLRISVHQIGDRMISEPEYNEEGELISEAEWAGETRYDIRIPDNYQVIYLNTRVYPKKADHEFQ